LYCTGDKTEKRCTGDKTEKRYTGYKTEKRCTATFFLSVNIMSNINIMLKKILTSFCCKITTEIQNLHLNVPGRPYQKVNGLPGYCLFILALTILQQPLE